MAVDARDPSAPHAGSCPARECALRLSGEKMRKKYTSLDKRYFQVYETNADDFNRRAYGLQKSIPIIKQFFHPSERQSSIPSAPAIRLGLCHMRPFDGDRPCKTAPGGCFSGTSWGRFALRVQPQRSSSPRHRRRVVILDFSLAVRSGCRPDLQETSRTSRCFPLDSAEKRSSRRPPAWRDNARPRCPP